MHTQFCPAPLISAPVLGGKTRCSSTGYSLSMQDTCDTTTRVPHMLRIGLEQPAYMSGKDRATVITSWRPKWLDVQIPDGRPRPPVYKGASPHSPRKAQVTPSCQDEQRTTSVDRACSGGISPVGKSHHAGATWGRMRNMRQPRVKSTHLASSKGTNERYQISIVESFPCRLCHTNLRKPTQSRVRSNREPAGSSSQSETHNLSVTLTHHGGH